MHSTHRAAPRRTKRALAAVVGLALLAAACGDKKSDDAVEGGDGTEAPDGTEATDATDAPEVTDATEDTAPPETAAPVDEIVTGGKIIMAVEAETGSPWTPANMQCDSGCQMRSRTFYDTLTATDQDLNWRPFLAESVTPNADSSEFTIKMRAGITFHDGTPVDGAAAMENINRNFNSFLLKGAYNDIARDPDGNIVFEVVDDMTFKIFTGKGGDPNQPISWPLFPYFLSGQAGMLGSPTWLAEVDADGAKAAQPVGTGPFIVESYAPGDSLVVKRNPNYWLKDAEGNQLPYLDEIEFRVITDSQVMQQAIEDGSIDMMASSDGDTLSQLIDNPDFQYLAQDQYGETNYFLLHLSKEGSPLQDRDVRCALWQAIDAQDMNEVIYNGFLQVANGPFSPGQEGYLEDNGSPQYDPDAAAATIAEYEAANGEVVLNFSTTTSATNLARANYMLDVWGAIGVDITINQIEQSKLINDALFGDPAFDAFGWRNHAGLFVDTQSAWWRTDAAGPDGAISLNFGRLSDPALDALLEQVRSTSDEAERIALTEDINRLFAENCWIIPLQYTRWGIVSDPKIKNIGRSPHADGGDGVFLRDGAGFPGQVWLTGAFVSE
jgi:peptide/nickel transport system substrate-binding protein